MPQDGASPLDCPRMGPPPSDCPRTGHPFQTVPGRGPPSDCPRKGHPLQTSRIGCLPSDCPRMGPPPPNLTLGPRTGATPAASPRQGVGPSSVSPVGQVEMLSPCPGCPAVGSHGAGQGHGGFTWLCRVLSQLRCGRAPHPVGRDGPRHLKSAGQILHTGAQRDGCQDVPGILDLTGPNPGTSTPGRSRVHPKLHQGQTVLCRVLAVSTRQNCLSPADRPHPRHSPACCLHGKMPSPGGLQAHHALPPRIH